MKSGVRPEQRFHKNRRCPICGGCGTDLRGQQRRCSGYVSADGKFVHCSREEHAGAIPVSKGDSQTYAHRATGECACGIVHRDDPNAWRFFVGPNDMRDIECAYDYRDESGKLLFQALRLIPKDFRQRQPKPGGGWQNNLQGVRRVLYRLPELLAADPRKFVHLAEGEKDVEELRSRGFVATCNPMGASRSDGKWKAVDDCASKALRGRHVVIIADNDEVGRAHAGHVARHVSAYAASVRIIEGMPGVAEGGDVSDWFAMGGTAEQFERLVSATIVSHERDDDDDFADRDTEKPSDEPRDESAAWKDELARALKDVTNALGSTISNERVPLFVDARALFTREYGQTPWLIAGLITRGGIAQFGAEPKSGKTWTLLEVAIAVATGTRVFGEFFAEQGHVGYFAAEDLDRQIRNRARALLSSRNLSPEALGDRLHVCPRGKTIDVMRDEDLAWVVASARRIGTKLDLLILDPLRDIHSGKENESDDMSNVMRRMKALGSLLGCTVAFAHHAGKPTKDNDGRRAGQRSRGSSAIYGSTDSGIYFGLRGGDGKHEFMLGVEVEIKGAAGAGRFAVRLNITDDEGGEAISAKWLYMKHTVTVDAAADKAGNDKLKPADKLIANNLFMWVRELAGRGLKCSRRELREHDERPGNIPHKKVYALLDYLLTEGRLVLIEGKICIPESPSEEMDS